MSRSSLRCLITLAALLVPNVAHAHVEHAAAGFISGLLHPVFGIDHFLAMLSVGIVSAQIGGSSIWKIPAVFVACMVIGAICGLTKFVLPNMEAGIASSVILLGLAIVIIDGTRFSYLVMACVAFFGFLHGYGHGLEMPASSDPVFYGGGFVVSTATIHVLGALCGHYMSAQQGLNRILRHSGSLMAGMGVMILLNVVAG